MTGTANRAHKSDAASAASSVSSKGKSTMARSAMHGMTASPSNTRTDDHRHHDVRRSVDAPQIFFKKSYECGRGNGHGDGHGDGNATSCYGRDQELKTLHQVFNQIVRKGTVTSPASSTVSTLPSTASSSSSSSTPACTHKARSNNNDASPSIPAAFVWGGSGTGKSHLVDAFCKQIRNKQLNKAAGMGIRILKGKFEQHQQNDPYSAITQAFSGWCNALATSTAPHTDNHLATKSRKSNTSACAGTTDLQRLRSQVKASTLTSEQINLLLSFVPSLSILINNDNSDQSPNAKSQSQSRSEAVSSQITANDTIWNRFQYAFSQLLTAISSKASPMILVLDDLQWASQQSMELMSTTMNHANFLWIGTIRQDYNPHSPTELLDLDPQVPFMKLLSEMRQAQVNESQDDASQCVDQDDGNDDGEDDEVDNDDGTLKPPYTNIHIANFTKQQLHLWLTQLLHRHSTVDAGIPVANGDDEDGTAVTAKIADYLYKQTNGNIFHSVQLLQDMERKTILKYNRIMSKWELDDEFDTDGVSDFGSSSSTDPRDVIRLISSQMKTLPVALQKALAIASYIRSSFDSDLLQIVLDYEEGHNRASDDIIESAVSRAHSGPALVANERGSDLSELLEQAVLEGLLHNAIGGTTYRFAHDRIQEAARGLVAIGELRTKLRLRIGRCLWELCTDPSLSHSRSLQNSSATTRARTSAGNDASFMFIATDHLNCVASKDHLETLQRNLQTGEHALQMAALSPAATYLRHASTALRKLKGDPWEDHYDLVLRLLRSQCDIELLLRNYEQGFAIGNEVVERATSIDDRLPTYATMGKALGHQGEHAQALRLSEKAAQLCGVYPKRGYLLHVARQMMSLRSYFRRVSNEEFLRRTPIVTNPKHVASILLLYNIITRGFISNDTISCLLGVVRMINYTRRVGFRGESGYGFAILATVYNSLGDPKSARRYIELAKAIVDKASTPSTANGTVYLMAASFIDPFYKSPSEIAQDFRTASMEAMSAGNFEVGVLGRFGSIVYAFVQGYPLATLLPNIDSVLEQEKALKVSSHKHTTREYSNSAKQIAGTLSIDWQNFTNVNGHDNVNHLSGIAVYWRHLFLATYLGRYELAEIVYDKMMAAKMVGNDFTSQTTIPLFVGLMASNRYWQTNQRKYANLLRKCKKQLKKICDTKGKIVLNRYLLLRAEAKSITSSTTMPTYVRQCYDKTIDLSQRNGQIHEAGLACEMAGEHILRSSIDGDDLAREYFTRAMEFYQAWGAGAKCDDLRTKRGNYINNEQVKRSARNSIFGEKTIEFTPQHQTSINFDLATVHSPEHAGAPTISGRNSTTNGTKTSTAKESVDGGPSTHWSGYAEDVDDGDEDSVLTDIS